MKKYLILADGEKFELSPLTYDEFLIACEWNGGSDTAYAAFLRQNKYREVDDFREEALEGAKVILEDNDGSILPIKYDINSDGF